MNGFLPPRLGEMPAELRTLPRWVTWRAEGAPGTKPRKVPYAATEPNTRASSTDPATWGTFAQAEAAYLEGGRTGVGFVLSGDGIVGGDIDGCVSEAGEVDPRALDLARKLGADYVELSPSGRGLRLLGYGPQLPRGVNGTLGGLHVELYSTGRYLTLTGRQVEGFGGELQRLRGFAEAAARIRKPAPAEAPEPGDKPGKAGKAHRLHIIATGGDGLHDALRDEAASLVVEGLRPDAVVRLLRALMDASTGPHDERWRARRAEIPELVRSAQSTFSTAAEFGGEAWAVPAPIALDEMAAARLSPRCIVENYLFADVGTLIAPGSTGKTTATLYEAVHIVLGRPLWGMRVVTPGPVLIVTAEDRREFLVARLREICAELRLTDAERARVREGVRIDDRTASIVKLTTIVCDVVTVAGFAQQIVEGAGDLAPVLVQFDPLVSFGVGESRVNDAEQGLIEAGRVIVAGLDCAVRYVHHTGKAPALEKRADQYTGRGGSALADGCRMVHVMQALDAPEVLKATDETLDEGESAFALHRPKLSYAPPQRMPLYVRRKGFAFELLRAKAAQSPDERARTLGEQLARFITAELTADRRHTRNSLRELRPDNMSRGDVMQALAWLESRGRVVERELLDPTGKRPATGARTYLEPLPSGGATAGR